MAEYSNTPLVTKLGIRAGARLALLDRPAGFAEETLGPLPDDVFSGLRLVIRRELRPG